jgi:Domain of unknown function (DUF4136)
MNQPLRVSRPLQGKRRHLLKAAATAAALWSLAGCAALDHVSVDVATYGAWPQGRAPGSYAFERLPSQAQAGAVQDQLETAAGAALERVGFSRAADAAQADVLVQFGSRQGKVIDPPPMVSWGIGLGLPIGRRSSMGFGMHTGSGWYGDRVRDYRELGLLLLDRASHQVLVEVQARHESRYGGDDLPEALFDAALSGFPALPAGERRVTVPLPPASR